MREDGILNPAKFLQNVVKEGNFENKLIMAHYRDLMYQKIDIFKIITQKESDKRE